MDRQSDIAHCSHHSRLDVRPTEMKGGNIVNIGIVGYGRMGKEIERLSLENEDPVVWIVDEEDNTQGNALANEIISKVDVCLEFTSPDVAAINVRRILSFGGKVVCGTTGWFHELSSIRPMAYSNGGGLVYGSNFSVGANLFARIVRDSSRLFASFPDYDVALHEIHHSGKVDHPSGTAFSLAEEMVRNLPGKDTVETALPNGAIDKNSLHVSSTRLGSFPGMHMVLFDSQFVTIEVRHTARSRTGFAMGALLAARWIADKEGVFSFEEVLSSILEDR